MPIFDIFKKKEVPKKEETLKKKVPEKKESPKRSFKSREIILKSPHVTEKATDLAGENKYVFKVSEKSNKTEIKKAVESLYNVDVLEVKIINIPAKKRRLGKQAGWRKGYKKAIVKVKEGQKIEILTR